MSIEGRVYVWKISEGPDEEGTPQITGKIVIAIQIVGEGEASHPRICWHCHKQVMLISLIKCYNYLFLMLLPLQLSPPLFSYFLVLLLLLLDGKMFVNIFIPIIGLGTFMQEVLVVGFGKRVLRIDTTKVGKVESFSAEDPLKCPVEKLIDGVQFVGKHDGEVTDLSMCQWMTTRLVSASMDGTVCIFIM